MTSQQEILWSERLHSAAHWSGVVRRGVTLRLSDEEGGANVAALFYNHEDLLERYNMPDTLKAQHTAFLTTGCVCYSDMGRILCSITADTCGWHDTICGVSNAKMLEARFGAVPYAKARNGMHRSGYDGLLNEVTKHGLGRRDLVANVNFFSKVVTDDAGRFSFVAGASKAGAHVDLRFEMNCLVVLSSAPHPLDPAPTWAPRPVRIEAFRGPPVAADDVCRKRCPENTRGFENTARYFA